MSPLTAIGVPIAFSAAAISQVPELVALFDGPPARQNNPLDLAIVGAFVVFGLAAWVTKSRGAWYLYHFVPLVICVMLSSTIGLVKYDVIMLVLGLSVGSQVLPNYYDGRGRRA